MNDKANNGDQESAEAAAREAMEQQQQVQMVPTQIVRHPRQTTAEKLEDGVVIHFIVMNGMVPEQHTYVVGEPGKTAILDALTGGLALP